MQCHNRRWPTGWGGREEAAWSNFVFILQPMTSRLLMREAPGPAGPRLAAQQCHAFGYNSTEIHIPVGFVGMFKMDSSFEKMPPNTYLNR